MLKALLHGKVGSSLSRIEEGESWRSLLQTTEDFLTALVLSRLAYLPDNAFWNILRESAVPKGLLPDGRYQLVSSTFWPRWAAPQKDRMYTEPDAVLVFMTKEKEEFIGLIIEAKVEGGAQREDQWANEWSAWKEQEGGSGMPGKTFLLAIGGIDPLRPQVVADLERKANALLEKRHESTPLKAIACSWGSLLQAVLLHMDQTTDESVLRILEDIVEGMDLSGIRNPNWLDDLGSAARKLQVGYASLLIMETWCSDFHHPVSESGWNLFIRHRFGSDKKLFAFLDNWRFRK